VESNGDRAAYVREGGQCAFVSADGRRCPARGFIEFDHVKPFAKRCPKLSTEGAPSRRLEREDDQGRETDVRANDSQPVAVSPFRRFAVSPFRARISACPNQVANARIDAIGSVFPLGARSAFASKCAATKRNGSAPTALTERHWSSSFWTSRKKPKSFRQFVLCAAREVLETNRQPNRRNVAVYASARLRGAIIRTLVSKPRRGLEHRKSRIHTSRLDRRNIVRSAQDEETTHGDSGDTQCRARPIRPVV